MALAACGAPVGGSARESNDAPAKKERSAQRNRRHKRGRSAGPERISAHVRPWPSAGRIGRVENRTK